MLMADSIMQHRMCASSTITCRRSLYAMERLQYTSSYYLMRLNQCWPYVSIIKLICLLLAVFQ